MIDLTDRFEALVTNAYAADEPGAAVLVAQDGKISYAKGQGLANLEWQIPIEPDMVFRYGSITKQFTAVAILMLLEQGKLQLDDTIPHRVSGYSQSPNGYVNSEYISMTQPYAAGSLAGTVYDLATWDNILCTDKLIRQETLTLAYEPFTLSNGEQSHYGFGWSFMNYEGHRLVSHSGGIHGFMTHALRELSTQSFVVVLSNNDSKSPELLAFQLMAEALGTPLRPPEPMPLPKETLHSYN